MNYLQFYPLVVKKQTIFLQNNHKPKGVTQALDSLEQNLRNRIPALNPHLLQQKKFNKSNTMHLHLNLFK